MAAPLGQTAGMFAARPADATIAHLGGATAAHLGGTTEDRLSGTVSDYLGGTVNGRTGGDDADVEDGAAVERTGRVV